MRCHYAARHAEKPDSTVVNAPAPDMIASMVDRAVVYIDGFNLYHGILSKYGRRFLWLDLVSLMDRLVIPTQQLEHVHYFTARVRNRPGSEQRQSDYIDALQGYSGPRLSIHEGRFKKKPVRCHKCSHSWDNYEEKETDVSLGVSLVAGAARREYDAALLVTADSDLCPAVRTASALHPSGRIVMVAPPNRDSRDLAGAVAASIRIGRGVLSKSQLPSPVILPDGRQLSRPATWT